ncbi:hypothetical protein HOLleu_30940 [Holothuria leucospilota]|uniref:Uncharacterized protein n=1 Tax=Holothuria leucospilota TaxID=206669 RepID=A0A9Q1BL31_HOLLE|nr:hypothetical protein HOLleu_30940 [Holothuria leucospilota]
MTTDRQYNMQSLYTPGSSEIMMVCVYVVICMCVQCFVSDHNTLRRRCSVHLYRSTWSNSILQLVNFVELHEQLSGWIQSCAVLAERA